MDGCCQTEPCPTMCAQAGSNLDNFFNDIGLLIKPFVPAINQRIANSGQNKNTLAGKLGAFTNQQAIILGGILVVLALVLLHK